ncbi:hypothetical protein Pcac1_g11543 [Phytophthora cactorum]|nr:hypothetical protein Pcac1_g11543 [Phytophthora cactorum]KAG2813473.1 hypothetical protein PC111_g14381 [Phytophthora cactorum]KAG2891328.1 hypothetical protein PC114_g17059 [Phytophthora cactorum]KAG2920851.1 hypothetical protein PC117_g16395 [Phytophthora cactorum]KAG3146269.1 hypothetical protein C6341_g18093 [Phytophthora cactorum]
MKHLTVYADNCSGRNKNNYVIKFLLTQVDMGRLEHVDYKFFVKGHTKNSCDLGFGHIRKHITDLDIWTMDHLAKADQDAASNFITVHVPHGSNLFKGYKEALTELYKRLDGIQQYQIFSMDCSRPGVVSCRKSPKSEVVEKNLRRKIDGILTPKEKVVRMLSEHVELLPPPAPIAEKISQLYQSIRPYIPVEFREDPLYAKPSAQEGESAKATKQARRPHCAAMAVAVKGNQDQRGIVEGDKSSEQSLEKQPVAAKKNANKQKTARWWFSLWRL